MIDEQELEVLQQILAEYSKAHRTNKASAQCSRIIDKIDTARYGHVIQAALDDMQKVLDKYQMAPDRIFYNKAFLADLSLIDALCERGVAYQREDLQAILALATSFCHMLVMMRHYSKVEYLPFLHLLRSFVPALQQQELLDYCRSACETLYGSVHLWGNFEPLQEAYQLRQQFEELLFGDNAPGLIFQLRRYAREDAPDSDEQAKALHATLLLERVEDLKYNHPAFEVLRQASPSVKKSLILIALREGIQLQRDMFSNERIVEMLGAEDLPWTDEDIQSILHILGQVEALRLSTTAMNLLHYALSLLQASGKAVHTEKELRVLDEKLAQLQPDYKSDQFNTLRQFLTEMLFAGGVSGLADLLAACHADQANEQESDKVRANALLAAYQCEFEDCTPPLDHPLLQQMERTLGASVKVRIISAVIRSKSLSERDINLVTILAAAPLACSKEEVHALLQSCVAFYSDQRLRELYAYSSRLDERERDLFLQWGAAIAASLRAIAPCLRQPDICAAVQEELLTLYTWSHAADYAGYFVIGTRETYELRLLLADLCQAGDSPDLAPLPRDEATQVAEEQARDVLAVYYREMSNSSSVLRESYHHRVAECIRATFSASFKWRLVNEIIQNRKFAWPEIGLIKILARDPLTGEKEDYHTFLSSSIEFFSSENLYNEHYQSLPWEETAFLQFGAVTIEAVLRLLEPSLRQPDVFADMQEELRTLYTLSYDARRTRYFRASYDQGGHALRLLVADLLFQGKAPGLLSLLHNDGQSEEAFWTEARARAVLAAYHDELGHAGLCSDFPATVLIKQRASQHFKVLLIKEAWCETYAVAQNEEHAYNSLPHFCYQNISLFWTLHTDELPYHDEDLLSVLLTIANILQHWPGYLRNLCLVEPGKNYEILDVFRAFLSRLIQSEKQLLQRDVLATLYEPFKRLVWGVQLDQDTNSVRLQLRGLLFPASAGPLRDLLQDQNMHFTSESEVRVLLAVCHEEFANGYLRGYYSRINRDEYRQLFQQRLNAQGLAWLVRLCAEEIPDIRIQPAFDYTRAVTERHTNPARVDQDLFLIQELFSPALPFTPEDIRVLLRCFQYVLSPEQEIMAMGQDKLDFLLRQPGVLAHCRAEIEAMRKIIAELFNKSDAGNVRRFYLMLCDVLGGHWQHFRYPLLPDRWGMAILDELASLSPTERDPWLALLDACAQMKEKTTASTWVEQASPLIEAIPTDRVTPTLRRWISLFSDKKEGHMEGTNSDILRTLIWLCQGNGDRGLAAALADAAIEGYRKLPGAGPRSPKVGDAAVLTLATMPGKDAISQLERVRRNVKQPSFQGKIGKTLDAVARREQMSREDMEELMLPTFDLQDGQLQIAVGEWTALLRAGGRKVELHWLDAGGQSRATLPVTFKREHKEEIKDINRLADDMEHLINSLRDRLEHMYLGERHWSLEDWRERYLEHPLPGVLARRLIWQVSSGEHNWRVIWHQGQLVNSQGQPCELPTQSEVTLWHPLMSDPQEVRGWQIWLEEQQITQPFKQAHREIYPITDAELAARYSSRRFADHVIRQRQLNVLARTRDWRFSLHSDFSGSIQNDPAYKEIPAARVRAKFTLSAPDQDQGIPRYLLTGEVQFQPIVNSLYDQQFTPLEEIPAILFSEIMRDVDLFVSVTSVGSDLYGYEDTDLVAEYWQSYNQKAASLQIKERRQLLERLLPQLAIGERCSLEEHFLIVRGDLCTYRINLLSGNIFMEPGNRYLCIVFDAQARSMEEGRFFLPFEGDSLLSLILSKAFLLAEDSKIKDKSILNQIHR